MSEVRDGKVALAKTRELKPRDSTDQARSREPILDGIRGVAILLVLGVHLPRIDGTGVIANGWLGVDLFFVLSGYLITKLLLDEWDKNSGLNLRRFYARRAMRLLPALYCSLFVFVMLEFAIIPDGFRSRGWGIEGASGPFVVLAVVLYVSNWFHLGALDMLWSISIEEQFYLLWPLALLVCLRAGCRIGRILLMLCVIVAGVCVARTLLYWQIMPDVSRVMFKCYQWTPARIDSPLVGCIAAIMIRWRGRPVASRYWSAIGWGSVIFLVYLNTLPDIRLDLAPNVASPLTHFTFTVGFTVVALACSLIVLSAMANTEGVLARILCLPLLRWFGRISYSLYLFHAFGFALARKLVSRSFISGLCFFALSMTLAVSFACVSYYFVEKPFLRMRQRFGFSAMGRTRESDTSAR